MRVSFLWQAEWEGGGIWYDTSYFIQIFPWPSTIIHLHCWFDGISITMETQWVSLWACFTKCNWARKTHPDWGDKGIHGRWTHRKTGTGWLVQTLLEWCQLDNNSETQWVYHVQHKEAVSVGNSLRFWSCGKRLWLLGFALSVNILTQTRGRQCLGISMGLGP